MYVSQGRQSSPCCLSPRMELMRGPQHQWQCQGLGDASLLAEEWLPQVAPKKMNGWSRDRGEGNGLSRKNTRFLQRLWFQRQRRHKKECECQSLFSVSSHIATAFIEAFYCESPSFTANKDVAPGELWLPAEENTMLWSTTGKMSSYLCFTGVLELLFPISSARGTSMYAIRAGGMSLCTSDGLHLNFD